MDWNTHYIWPQFFLFACLTVFAGTLLTRYGDRIAEITGLGRMWVGAVVLSFVTSLPEVVTSCSAAHLGKPDIALQNVMGSNLFNLLILAILDFSVRGRTVLADADRGHLITARAGAMMMLLAAAVIFCADAVSSCGVQLAWYDRFPVGPGTIAIAVVYLWVMRKISTGGSAEAEIPSPGVPEGAAGGGSHLKVYGVFIASAAVIVLSGYRMSLLGKIISETPFRIGRTEFQLTDNFVGMILIAVATSLPELVVTLSAARIGASEMAIGNVLGSNVFNMTIIFAADAFYQGAPILSAADPAAGYTAIFGLVLTLVVIDGIARPRGRPVFGRLGLHTAAVLVIYLLGMFILTRLGLLVA